MYMKQIVVSFCYTAETNTTLLSNYCPIKIKKKTAIDWKSSTFVFTVYVVCSGIWHTLCGFANLASLSSPSFLSVWGDTFSFLILVRHHLRCHTTSSQVDPWPRLARVLRCSGHGDWLGDGHKPGAFLSLEYGSREEDGLSSLGF